MSKSKLFIEHFEEWVETYKEGAVRDVTLQKYLKTLEHLQRIVPDLKLKGLDRREYQKILNEYAKTHERQTTMDFHHQVKSCIQDLFHEGLLERDPTFKAIIKGKPPTKKRQKFLEMDELKALIQTLDIGNEINWDWFLLIVAKTGLRFAEALAITPQDFDLENNLLNIDKTWNYKKASGGFTLTKNQSSVRKVKLDWQIVGQFTPLIKDLPEDEPIFVEKEENGQYKRIFNSTINNYLFSKCEEAGIPVISIHSLRHTHASILLSAGVTIHSIADRLGHATVTTTQETYLHIISDLEKKDNQLVMGTLTSIT